MKKADPLGVCNQGDGMAANVLGFLFSLHPKIGVEEGHSPPVPECL